MKGFETLAKQGEGANGRSKSVESKLAFPFRDPNFASNGVLSSLILNPCPSGRRLAMGDDSDGSLSDSTSPPDLVPYGAEEMSQYPVQRDSVDGDWNHEEVATEETFEATGTRNTNALFLVCIFWHLHACRR